jgi:transposase InsO family protein
VADIAESLREALQSRYAIERELGRGGMATRCLWPTERPDSDRKRWRSIGTYLDNTVAESFFYTLKTELVYHNQYRTGEEARLVIFDYIAAFYNRTRRHSSIGYRSPDDHKAQYALP